MPQTVGTGIALLRLRCGVRPVAGKAFSVRPIIGNAFSRVGEGPDGGRVSADMVRFGETDCFLSGRVTVAWKSVKVKVSSYKSKKGKIGFYLAQYPVLRIALHLTPWQICSFEHNLDFSRKHSATNGKCYSFFVKCKCMHLGHGNKDKEYITGILYHIKYLKKMDLVVNRYVSEQCGIVVSKGTQTLGLIRRNNTYKEKQLIVQSNSYATFGILYTRMEAIL